MQYRHPEALKKKQAGYFHPIEIAGREEIGKCQDDKLVEQMAYLEANSPFYREKFGAAGIRMADMRGVDDLKLLPFTTKQELRSSIAAAPPFGLHRAAALEDIVQMQSSSGTTGAPAYVALTASDTEMWQELSARGLFVCGIRPGDFVLHAFSMSKGFVGGIPCFQAVQYMGAVDVPVGADGGIDRLLRACADVRPRAILGTPYFVRLLGESAPEILGRPASDLGVERIVVGGEPGGGIPAVRRSIEEVWGAKVCELMGGTDLGVIYWGECDEQSGMHMVCQDYIIVELIDPQTEAVLDWDVGARGELVYTAIGRRASPLLRFRSGDHVEVTGTSCRCGRTGPKIRCFGRTDDMLIVRGVNVFPSAIQDIVTALQPRTSGHMRVLKDFAGHTTQANLKVLVERGEDRPPAQDTELKELVAERLRNAIAFKADVRIVPAGTFEKPGVQKVSLTIHETPSTKRKPQSS